MCSLRVPGGTHDALSAQAVVFDEPGALTLRELELTPPGPDQAIVDVEWTGISTGTERLLYSGRMPAFPGMGYPLVPGYETVGRVVACNAGSRFARGDRVFVSGARCFRSARGLFGGAASRLVVDESGLLPLCDTLGEEGILLALAATAHHVLSAGRDDARMPGLIVGHGVLGRLLARMVQALGGDSPAVWETSPARGGEGFGYRVLHPDADPRRDYACIVDASGDPGILDTLIARLAKGGEIVLAGFYSDPLSFRFPPAFMREASIRVAAEWTAADLGAVNSLVASGTLSLAGLITHRSPAVDAAHAYPVAFSDPDCLKMVLDWRSP